MAGIVRPALGCWVLASGLSLAGCQSAAELEQAAVEARRTSCLEAGFAEGSDAYRLCLILQETQDRIARVERRIDFLDAEISGLRTFGRWYGWP